MKTRSIRARTTSFGDFCDDNVCACTVSTLILLLVANLSPEMGSVTQIFLQHERFACNLMFEDILNKLLKSGSEITRMHGKIFGGAGDAAAPGPAVLGDPQLLGFGKIYVLVISLGLQGHSSDSTHAGTSVLH